MADNDPTDNSAGESASKQTAEALMEDARMATAKGGRSGGYSLAYSVLTTFELNPDQEAEMFFLKGLGLFRMGNFKDAVSDFDEVIHRDRLHVEAHHLRADCHRELFDRQKAAEGYSRVIILQPDNALAYYRRATEGFDILDRKIADLSEAISAKADFREAFEARGRCYIDSKQFEQAVADFTDALALYPAYCDALCWRARAYYELGRYEEALQDCDLYAAIALGSFKCDGLVQDIRSKSFAILGQSETPILSALEISDDTDFVAGSLSQEGETHSSETLAEEWQALADAIDAAPSFDENFEDQSTEALIEFAVEASQSEFASSRRIISCVNLVFTREASLPFKTRIDLLMARGKALLDEREYAFAIADFDWLVEADERSIEAYRLRARAHEQLDDTKAAIRDYTLLLAIMPDDATALSHISWLLVTGGGLGEDAVNLAKRAVKLDDAIWIRNNLAAAHATSGEFALAVAEQQTVVQRIYESGEFAAIPPHQRNLDYYRWEYTTWGNEKYTWHYKGLSEQIRKPFM